MDSENIANRIKGRFATAILESDVTIAQPFVRVQLESLTDLCTYLRNDPELAFDFLMCISGIDWKDSFEVVYHLYSFTQNHKIVIKVKLDKEKPVVPSVTSIWGAANWHEREAYDLVGITFENHPDLRRILLPEDWEGHPLRKDYVPQKEYHEIDLT